MNKDNGHRGGGGINNNLDLRWISEESEGHNLLALPTHVSPTPGP